ncbi:DMT family transporter [Kiloniella sp. b19]|uniref:DMT family transporter n=1 Tax=Kiloniella sp. GXU_MW_B19 TaxID=3141326 RepID=UPI0031D1E6BF
MTRFQANLLLMVAATIWGSTFFFQHQAMDAMGPQLFTACRFLLGGLFVVPFAMRECRKLREQRQANPTEKHGKGERLFSTMDWGLMIVVGLFIFMGTILQQIGIIYTTVTKAGFLTAIYVPLVPIMGYLFFRDKPHFLVVFAVLSSFFGTFLLSGADLGMFLSLSLNKGDAYVMASALFWAAHVLVLGRVAVRVGSPLTLAATQFLVCAVISGVFAIATEEISWAAIVEIWPMIAYAGIGSVGIAFTLQVVGQAHTQATDAAIILSMETLVAALCGALFLSERLTALEFLGCALIFSAVLIVEVLPLVLRKLRKKAVPQT